MSNYRRWFVPGGMVFFTVVTYARRPILTTEIGRFLLRSAIQSVQAARPFQLFATVLLPDHWHLVMSLPAQDEDYSTRIKQIKEGFTSEWLAVGYRKLLSVTRKSAVANEAFGNLDSGNTQ